MIQSEELASENNSGASVSFFNKASFYLLLGLTFLFPLFFLTNVSFQFSKSIFLTVFILLAFICWAIATLQEGSVSYPKSLLSLSALLIPIPFLASAFFGGDVLNSIIGGGFEIGTLTSILLAVLALFLAAELLNTKKRIFYFYLAFAASFFILAIYQISRLIFGADFLSFGVFGTLSSNLLGKWNELGIFFGFTTILSLVTIEAFSKNRLFKVIGVLMLIVSLIFLALVNFFSIWIVLGLFALISTIYVFAFARNNFASDSESAGKGKRLPVSSLIVLVLSFLFIIAGARINDQIAKHWAISELEVRPSWGTTIDIAKQALKANPIFGSGPNQFVGEWLQNKPEGVNSTLFWNTDFNFGVGLLPTFVVTTGILGLLAWIFFLLMFLRLGLRAIFTPNRDMLSRYIILSSFFGALYLWIYQIFYVPTHVTFILPFLFTGVFLAAVQEAKIIEKKDIFYTTDPKKSFFAVLLLIVFIIGSVTWGFFVSQRFMSAYYVQKGLRVFNESGDVTKPEEYILQALRMYKNSEYYRVLAQLYVYKMNTILNDKETSSQVLKARFGEVLPKAIEAAKNAVTSGPNDYQNYITLGSVYEAVLSLGDKNAYAPAKEAYTEAQKLNPKSPAVLLLQARLETVNNDIPKAKELVLQAIQMKNNYTEAIYLLSQIEISQNNVKGAIDAVSAVAYLNPDDPGVFFQLGFLKYSDKDYAGAAQALERAVQLADNYSNARYFLGLSYAAQGRTSEAIEQFVAIQKLNPDNNEVALILSNLRAGKAPFENAKPPVDNKPEQRKTLPVKEAL